MVELAAIDERQEDKERSMFKDVLKQLEKEREEEDEARALIEEMRQNLEEAQARASETERKMGCVLGEIQTLLWKRSGASAPHHGQDVADDAKQRH